MSKQFSQASENNKSAILDVLRQYFVDVGKVLEIGSGSGQHAAYFSYGLPHVIWQPSDLIENHPSIEAWLQSSEHLNWQLPLELDVDKGQWKNDTYSGVFSANTAHIMSWNQVVKMISGISKTLLPGGIFILYGPFNYGGEFTSESNARFNQWLISQAPHRAIRDFERVESAAREHGLTFLKDCKMPANNRCLVFKK